MFNARSREKAKGGATCFLLTTRSSIRHAMYSYPCSAPDIDIHFELQEIDLKQLFGVIVHYPAPSVRTVTT
jgi:hypothetical protein